MIRQTKSRLEYTLNRGKISKWDIIRHHQHTLNTITSKNLKYPKRINNQRYFYLKDGNKQPQTRLISIKKQYALEEFLSTGSKKLFHFQGSPLFTDHIDQKMLDSVSAFEYIPRLQSMILSNIDSISVQE